MRLVYKNNFTISSPFDGHLHLRNGGMLETVLPSSAKDYGSAIVMPNLKEAIRTVDMAHRYHDEIMRVAEKQGFADFKPLMTLYLSEDMQTREVELAAKDPLIAGIKVYPKGGTTNASEGVRHVDNIKEILRAMEVNRVRILWHPEKADMFTNAWKRENLFIQEQLKQVIDKYEDLPMVIEHISTIEAAMLVMFTRKNIVATVTPHHLYYDSNSLVQRVSGIDGDLFQYDPEKYPLPKYVEEKKAGPDPHSVCMPVLKDELHRAALIYLVTSGFERIFAGTDSAPHQQSKKESGCGCAGCFVAAESVAMYARIFDHYRAEEGGVLKISENLLNKKEVQKRFENFMSVNGRKFYDQEIPDEKLQISREENEVPMSVGEGENVIVPLMRGDKVRFKTIRSRIGVRDDNN